MLAWHFIPADGRIAANLINNRPALHAGVRVAPGLRLTVPGPPVPERWGLHASPNPADAAFWAPSLLVCRVEVGGEILPGDRKVAATERTVLWMADARAAFWEWACLNVKASLENAPSCGGEIHPIAVESLRARWDYVRALKQNDSRALALAEQRMAKAQGPISSLYRRACSENAKGVKIYTPWHPATRGTIRMCRDLVWQRQRASWQGCAARTARFAQSERAKAEAALLESLLLKLGPTR